MDQQSGEAGRCFGAPLVEEEVERCAPAEVVEELHVSAEARFVEPLVGRVLLWFEGKWSRDLGRFPGLAPRPSSVFDWPKWERHNEMDHIRRHHDVPK